MRTNAEIFKVIDPAGQSVLLILFGYSLDSGNSYRKILFILLAWQIVSWIVHFFIKSIRLLKDARLLYTIAILIYLPTYIYVTKKVKETFVEVRDAHGLSKFPAHEVLFTTIGLIIAFWYYVICFREIKTFYKRNSF